MRKTKKANEEKEKEKNKSNIRTEIIDSMTNIVFFFFVSRRRQINVYKE